ncbi:MAG TPA: hypothetical protein PKH07_11665, partial [bacterium]|nr:hypothetical protein [bacterium]
MKRFLIFSLLLVLVPNFATAKNPILVDKGGAGDFTTIQQAIESWCPSGTNYAENEPFVIEVSPSAPYIETMSLNDGNTDLTAAPGRGDIKGDIIIRSSVSSVYADVRLNANGEETGAGLRDGLWIYQQTADVTFENIIFSPEVTGTIDDDLVKIDKNADSAANTITFKNCIFTDTKDAGGPLTTSRADAQRSSNVTYVGKLAANDNLVKIWNDNAEFIIVNFDRSIISTAKCNGIVLGGIAGPAVGQPTGPYELNAHECVFSYVGTTSPDSAIRIVDSGDVVPT